MLLGMLLLLAGCQGFDPAAWIQAGEDQIDQDQDGVSVKNGDCDESCENMMNVNDDGMQACSGWFIHPGVEDESPRPFGPNVDYDCNGVVDGQEPGADFDSDGYSPVPTVAGEPGDCNDLDSRVHAEHEECCGDQLDNDCDGRVDEAACVESSLSCPLATVEGE